jgi:hypothetical protein
MKWMTVILCDSSGSPYTNESVRVTAASVLTGSTHEDRDTNSRGEAEFNCKYEQVKIFAKGQLLYTGYPEAVLKFVV